MSHSAKHPAKPRLQDEEINPWNVEENIQPLGPDYVAYNPYQYIHRHNIAFNPESNKKEHSNNKAEQSYKDEHKSSTFTDNLRKYEKKKADELRLRHQINYIQKNRKELVEEIPINIPCHRPNNMGISDLFIKERTFRGHSEQSQQSPQLANWSLIMYYQNENAKKRHYHRDLHSFLKFHSKKIDSSHSQKDNQPETAHQHDANRQDDAFQKMLKLKEGIRKRNLKSASSSRQNLEASRQEQDQSGLSLRNTIHSQNPSSIKTNHRRLTPRTSHSSREKPHRTLQYKVIVTGKTSSIVMGLKEDRPEIRMIHSSHKNRGRSKMLNIQGSKINS